MSERSYGILVAGVGGQEAERAAEIIARAAIAAGLEAALSVERPASRRGGSALGRVRIASGEIASAFAPPGEADLLLGLERLEALRRVHELRADGLAVVADRTIPTPRMRAGLELPPPDAIELLRAEVARAVELQVGQLFPAPASPAAVAGAFLGVAAGLLPIPAAAWDEAVSQACPGTSAGLEWLEGLERGRAFFEALPSDVRCPPAPQAA